MSFTPKLTLRDHLNVYIFQESATRHAHWDIYAWKIVQVCNKEGEDLPVNSTFSGSDAVSNNVSSLSMSETAGVCVFEEIKFASLRAAPALIVYHVHFANFAQTLRYYRGIL